MRAWPTSDAYLSPLPLPSRTDTLYPRPEITHLSLPTPRWPGLGPHGPTCSGPRGLDWWQKIQQFKACGMSPEDSLSGSEMENTQWWCLLWGSPYDKAPTGFSSMGTEKKCFKNTTWREENGEVYTETQRPWEWQKEKESLEQRGPRAAPSSKLSFSPSHDNPSPCVDLQKSCFLIKEEKEREEEERI